MPLDGVTFAKDGKMSRSKAIRFYLAGAIQLCDLDPVHVCGMGNMAFCLLLHRRNHGGGRSGSVFNRTIDQLFHIVSYFQCVRELVAVRYDTRPDKRVLTACSWRECICFLRL